ncbi:DUF2254 domain-containing protein [Paracoccus aerodenitrificans]|uniref:DUF2254 domain-containing protein n=1 Tax=Paracoccus aerodenitrificans TaxID=3017781 RepID=UPI0022F0FD5F|nr:DUF2254 family protein [Paracoccus aerodenitrificans]WBU64416.1 DUF2254 domain-containing protein [Paracoccus aerodenitrificans]
MSWSKLSFQAQELLAQIWVRVLAFAVLGVATALVALLIGPFIPPSVVARLGAESVGTVLQIIASSMLAVTIFSLSTLVNAWTNAEQHATPRALPLIVGDSRSQTALSTFIGAFVFSLVGIIMLQTGAYGGSGRVVVFAATVVVVVLVIFALLQWIEALSDLGQIRDVLDRLEDAVGRAIEHRQDVPWLGGLPWSGEPPSDAEALLTEAVGYVRHIDAGSLQAVADEHELTIYIEAIPGTRAHAARPLLHIVGLPPKAEEGREALLKRLMNAFTIGYTPSFEQDPLHGLTSLSEVAQRALSSAINDPGTANDVIQRQLNLLTKAGPIASDYQARRPRLFAREISSAEMVQAAFAAIARDAGGIYEVQSSLMNALIAITKIKPDYYGTASDDLGNLIVHYSEAANMPPIYLESIKERNEYLHNL